MSGLEELRSDSNETIFRLNGKLLASKVDPKREALQWVEKNHQFANHSKTIVVLGIGSGHHLAMLRAKYPNATIIAISTSSELIEAIQVTHKSSVSSILFYEATTLEHFCDAELTQVVFSTSTVVLKHPTYKIELAPVLEEIEEAIVARTELSLRRYIEKNVSLSMTVTGVPSMIGLASIKTVKDSLHPVQQADSTSGLAIRALVELLK